MSTGAHDHRRLAAARPAARGARPGWCRSSRRACCRWCRATCVRHRADRRRASTTHRGGAAGCSPARCCSSPGFTVVFVSAGRAARRPRRRSCSSTRRRCSAGSAALTIVLGLAFMGFVPWLQRDVRLRPAARRSGWPARRCSARCSGSAGPRASGRRSAPCMALASTRRPPPAAALLAVAYCLGLGLPVRPRPRSPIGRAMGAFGWVKRHYLAVMRIGGGDARRHRRAAGDRRLERHRRSSCRSGSTASSRRCRRGRPDADRAPPPGTSRRSRRPPALRPLGWLRWAWRQLTSMRTALVLLFLLALAAVPGSLVPQRGIDAGAGRAVRRQHPHLAPWYDRLSLFDVFSSPWFAAIYLLLFVSLVGCVLPRSRAAPAAHRAPAAARAAQPRPAAGARRRYAATPTPDEVLAEARTPAAGAAVPGRRRATARSSAEKGYLRETGNLVFHLALLRPARRGGPRAPVRLQGQRPASIEGEAFSNTRHGLRHLRRRARWSTSRRCAPFTVTLDDLKVRYQPSGQQRGAPRDFEAYGPLHDVPGRAGAVVRRPRSTTRWTSTARRCSCSATATRRSSRCATRRARSCLTAPVPFLPRDGNDTSIGVSRSPARSRRRSASTASSCPPR